MLPQAIYKDRVEVPILTQLYHPNQNSALAIDLTVKAAQCRRVKIKISKKGWSFWKLNLLE